MTCVETPTIATANEVMTHKTTAMVVVTGGGAVVKAAMNSGKKCVAAGPETRLVVDMTRRQTSIWPVAESSEAQA